MRFPPIIRFRDWEELIATKSILISEARLLIKTQEGKELGVLYFHQAGRLEQRLIAAGNPVSPPTADTRAISAASCLGHGGDLQEALALLGSLRLSLDEDVVQFRRVMEFRLATSTQVAERLKRAFENKDEEAVMAAAQYGIGLLPPRVLYWPQYRLAEDAGATGRAKVALQRLIISDPFEFAWHYCYSALLQDEERRNYSRYMAEGFSGDYRSRVALAYSLLDREDALSEAADSADEAIRLMPNDAKDSIAGLAFAVASCTARRRGDAQRARALLKEAVERRPQDAELRTLYGGALLAVGEGVFAEREWDVAFSLNGETHWAATLGGAQKLLSRDAVGAVPMLLKAVERSTGVVRAKNLNNLGVALALTGREEDAGRCFEEALALADSLHSAASNRANLAHGLELHSEPPDIAAAEREILHQKDIDTKMAA